MHMTQLDKSWHLDTFLYKFKVTWADKNENGADLQVEGNNDSTVQVVYFVYSKVRGKFVCSV